MRYDKLPALEQQFKSTQNNGRHQLKPFSLAVEPGWIMKGVYVDRQDGFQGFWENEKITKETIVLHYTVGNLKGDITTLTPAAPRGYPNRKNRLSTAYVVARDGTIYNLFHSGGWAYHLGKNAIGGNGNGSKKSVAIELSNYGPLKLSSDRRNLETIYSKPGRPDIYCSLQDTTQFIKLNQPYRGFQYFCTFTDAQYESLIILLRYLTKTHNIPREFVPESTRYQAIASAALFKGINSHVNYRTTGKTDIGPAFEWDRVIQGVQAQTYTAGPGNVSAVPVSAAGMAGAAAGISMINMGMRTRGMGSAQPQADPVFQSEDDIERAFVTRSLQPDEEEGMDWDENYDPTQFE